MANIKSAKKSIKQDAKRAEKNRCERSRVKTLAKRVKIAAESKSADLKTIASEYVSAIDKAAKRHVVHPNRAKRQKQAVAKYIFA